jgi:iron complex outermembrane recepter protein
VDRRIGTGAAEPENPGHGDRLQSHSQDRGETALPVQVITREQIERAGIQTAAELLNTVSANMSFNSFSETQAITGGSGQPGFAGASLRGLAYQKTLILFNGRRIANFALGTKGGDLNAIPLSAIDRVEVLKDGASAVYGADATAGVINFILRKDYQGAEAYAQYTSPQHTGGYSKRYNFAAGYGNLATQKFNAFAMLDYQPDLSAAVLISDQAPPEPTSVRLLAID